VIEQLLADEDASFSRTDFRIRNGHTVLVAKG